VSEDLLWDPWSELCGASGGGPAGLCLRAELHVQQHASVLCANLVGTLEGALRACASGLAAPLQQRIRTACLPLAARRGHVFLGARGL